MLESADEIINKNRLFFPEKHPNQEKANLYRALSIIARQISETNVEMKLVMLDLVAIKCELVEIKSSQAQLLIQAAAIMAKIKPLKHRSTPKIKKVDSFLEKKRRR